MAKKYDISVTRIYKRVMEMEEKGEWPFKTMTAEKFLDSVRPLIKSMDDIFNGEIDGKKLPAAVFQDQNTGAAIQMLKAIQTLEYEEKDVEMALLVEWAIENLPHNLSTEEMQSFFAEWSEYMMPDERTHQLMFDFILFAKEEMYRYNSQANVYMREVMEADGLTPRYIGEENERDYIPTTMREFASDAARAHEESMRIACEEIDNLIKYGLPSETKAMQLKDSVLGIADEKERNQTIIDRILSCEADLEIVNLYILPELALRIKELEGKAQIEAELAAKGVKTDGNDFYQKELERYVEAQKAIKDALQRMKENEIAMQQGATIEVSGMDKGKCKVVLARIKGGRQEIREVHNKRGEQVDIKAKSIKERAHRERSITLELGSSSRKMYAEKRRAAAVALGYTQENEVVGQKHGIKNTIEAKVGEAEMSQERTTKMSGKRTIRIAASANIARFKDRAVHLKRDEDGKVKEKRTIAEAKVAVGSASASFDTKKTIPIASASIKGADASLEVLGVKASASVGTVGYSTDPGIDKDSLKGKGIEQAFDTIIGGKRPDVGQTVIDTAKSAVGNLTKVSTGLAKAGISIGGVSVLGASLKDGEFVSTEDKISEVKDFVGRVQTNGIGEVLKGISPLEQDEIDGQPIEAADSINATEVTEELDIEEIVQDDGYVPREHVDMIDVDDQEEYIVVADNGDRTQ